MPGLFARFNPKPASPNFYSLEQEVQAGQQAAAEVDKSMPLVNDPELNRYIQNLGARLVAVAPGLPRRRAVANPDAKILAVRRCWRS